MSIAVRHGAEKQMIKHLLSLQSDGKFCDLTIKTGGEPVHAHKCILASSLDYFRTSFSFSAAASTETDIDLSHLQCDSAVVLKVIRSLYSNEIHITESDVAGILQLADYFMHNDLLLTIQKYMEKTLDISKAALFFQLCLQYGFDKGGLFHRTYFLLSSRMHDYLMHQPSALDWTLDVVEAMMGQGIFDYCTPLQVTKFILKKLDTLLFNPHLYQKEELSETSLAIVTLLDLFFSRVDNITLFKWSSSIEECIRVWRDSVRDQITTFGAMTDKLNTILESAKAAAVAGKYYGPETLDTSPPNWSEQKDASSLHIKQREITTTDVTSNTTTCPTGSSLSNDKNITGCFTNNLSSTTNEPTVQNHLVFSNTTVSLEGETLNKARISHSSGCSYSNCASDKPSTSAAVAAAADDDNGVDSLSPNRNQNATSTLMSPPSSNSKSEIKSTTTRTMSSPNDAPSSSNSSLTDMVCSRNSGLVVLSPSYDMVSQLMEVEARTAKPLLRSPELSLHFYDPDFRVWRFAGNLKFPLQGYIYMSEKHAWKMAYVRNSLFLFSLVKRKGLEYNVDTGEWTELSCDAIFQPHISSSTTSSCVNVDFSHQYSSIDAMDDPWCEDGTSEARHSSIVRSVIPISMSDDLVVLSLSRQPRGDGSFLTQQHIYQFDFQTRRFQHITCVSDARMSLPMTKWTVDEHNLVTVKASTIMFGDLQVFNIQHIHVYNSKSRRLETHHVECAMKTGLKIFLRGNKLYLLNNFHEYRFYCLESRELSHDWVKLPFIPPPLDCGYPELDIFYPADLRLSCHAGSSRWVMNSNFFVDSAILSELYFSEDGVYHQDYHPNPPFLYMTTMCSAKLNKARMASFDQAVFRVRNNKT